MIIDSIQKMKRFFTAILVFVSVLCYSQITIIPTNSDNNLLTISVLPNNIIVAGWADFLVRSTDDCNTLLPLSMPEPTDYDNYLIRINSSLSYMVSASFNQNRYRVYKSTDDCNTWVLKLDTVGFFMRHLRFFNNTDGYGVTSTIYQSIKTNNGGSTWTTQSSIPTIMPMDLQVQADSLVCLAGSNGGSGSFFVSQNRGRTWTGTTTYLETIPRKIQILSQDTFLVTSYNPYPAAFLKSVDKGQTFQKVNFPNVTEVYGINFKNFSEGYVLGKGINNMGVILKTTDFGNTWATFDSQIPCTLLDMKFLNDSVAIVSGTNGVLFKWNNKNAVFTSIKKNTANDLLLDVYPNPINENQITIKTDNTDVFLVNIYNSLGEKILIANNLTSPTKLDVGSIPSGIYFIEVLCGARKNMVKVVK